MWSCNTLQTQLFILKNRLGTTTASSWLCCDTDTFFFPPEDFFLPWGAEQKSRAVPLIKRNLCESLWQLHPVPSCQPLLISLNTHSALHSALEKLGADSALYSNTLRINVLFLSVEKEFNYSWATESSYAMPGSVNSLPIPSVWMYLALFWCWSVV